MCFDRKRIVFQWEKQAVIQYFQGLLQYRLRKNRCFSIENRLFFNRKGYCKTLFFNVKTTCFSIENLLFFNEKNGCVSIEKRREKVLKATEMVIKSNRIHTPLMLRLGIGILPVRRCVTVDKSTLWLPLPPSWSHWGGASSAI